MIKINKDEKEAILERFPYIRIIRTMKQDSKRHHYYMEEVPRAVRYLNKLRGIDEPDAFSRNREWKRGVRHQ